MKKSMKRIRERIDETSMWADGAFMSEDLMIKEGISEHLCCK